MCYMTRQLFFLPPLYIPWNKNWGRFHSRGKSSPYVYMVIYDQSKKVWQSAHAVMCTFVRAGAPHCCHPPITIAKGKSSLAACLEVNQLSLFHQRMFQGITRLSIFNMTTFYTLAVKEIIAVCTRVISKSLLMSGKPWLGHENTFCSSTCRSF